MVSFYSVYFYIGASIAYLDGHASWHLPMLQTEGFRAIEISFYHGRDHFDWRNPKTIRELRHIAGDLGIRVWSIHSPDLHLLTTEDASHRQEQVDALKYCLDSGEELGAKVVVSHALCLGSYDKDPQAAVECVRKGLTEVHQHAHKGNVVIGYENTPFVSDRNLTRACKVIERLREYPCETAGFVWDTGHSNMYGDGQETVDCLGDRLVSWHINDNPGDADIHLAPGEGNTDWSMMRPALEVFQGPIIYEVHLAGA